jgi:ankyrin repeat protein
VARTPDELFTAIDADDVERVRGILADEPSRATSRDAHGVSALLRARYRGNHALVDVIKPSVGDLDAFESAVFGDVERLRSLLDQRPDIVRERSGDGFTLLHLAAFFGRQDAVELLLASGAETDGRATGWMTGTPLHSAASSGNVAIVRTLLAAGADPTARQSGGGTALHAAAQNGDPRMAEMLLQAGADPAALTDDGRSALDMARDRGDAETIAALEAALRS